MVFKPYAASKVNVTETANVYVKKILGSKLLVQNLGAEEVMIHFNEPSADGIIIPAGKEFPLSGNFKADRVIYKTTGAAKTSSIQFIELP